MTSDDDEGEPDDPGGLFASPETPRAVAEQPLAAPEISLAPEAPSVAPTEIPVVAPASPERPPPSSARSSSSGASSSSSSSSSYEAVARPRLGGDWQRVKVDGGYLTFSKKGRQLDAHCAFHGPACKCDRTMRPGPRKGQGRPLGRQLLWLASGSCCVEVADDDMAAHQFMKKDVGERCNQEMRLRLRRKFEKSAARVAVKRAILEAERSASDDAYPEPAVAP